jgi:hypothetical protein
MMAKHKQKSMSKGKGDSSYTTKFPDKNKGENTSGKGAGDPSFKTTYGEMKGTGMGGDKGAGDPSFKTDNIAGQKIMHYDSRGYQVKGSKHS